MNQLYVASHIKKIRTQHANNPNAIENSLWRIASNADIFWDGNSDNLNPDGTLTDKQCEKVWEFIENFQASPSGIKALKTLEVFF